MIKKINLENAKQLIKGASILTTGGGLSIDEQLRSVEQLKNFQVNLVSLNELQRDGYLCLVGELGPSSAPPLKKENVIRKMLRVLEKQTNKKIVGIYPPEIGQESIVLESAYYLHLPIADLDPVGSRAVPFIDINVFNVKEITYSLTPMVVCNDREEILVIDGQLDQDRVEEILRKMTSLSSTGIIFLIGALVSVKVLLDNNLQNSSYSQALNLGLIHDITNLKNFLKPKLVIKGQVVGKSIMKIQGFSAVNVFIEDQEKIRYSLIILNEALFLIKDKDSIISEIPDKILLINGKKFEGFPSTKIKKGSKIFVMVLNPDKIWSTKRAKQIFGKERFKFLLEMIKND